MTIKYIIHDIQFRLLDNQEIFLFTDTQVYTVIMGFPFKTMSLKILSFLFQLYRIKKLEAV